MISRWKIVPFFTLWMLCIECPAQEPFLYPVGSLSIPGGVRYSAVHDRYAYLWKYVSGEGFLLIVDIFDPAHPFEVNRTALRTVSAGGGGVTPFYRNTRLISQAAFEWPYFYYTSEEGLRVLDVSDPYHPISIVRDWMRGSPFSNSYPIVRNRRALFYTGRTTNSRVELIDLSDWSSPQSMGVIQLSIDKNILYWLWNENDYAYGIIGNERLTPDYQYGEELIVFYADGINAFQSASYPMQGLKTISRVGEWIYAVLFGETARSGNRLQLINVSDPRNPAFGDAVQLNYYVHEFFPCGSFWLSFAYDKNSYISLFHQTEYSVSRSYDLPLADSLGAICMSGDSLLGITSVGSVDRLAIYRIVVPSAIPLFRAYD